MTTCLIGVGSNLGDRQKNLQVAIEKIAAHPHVQLTKQSRMIGSDPVGGPSDQGAFINGAVRVETSLTPRELLEHLLVTEISLGRVREVRWAPRTIDLDLLLVEGQAFSDDRLTVPHPWMTIRPFVMEPVVEIAPNLVHPLFGLTMEQIWTHVQTAPNRLVLVASTRSSGENAMRATGLSSATEDAPSESNGIWDCELVVADELTKPHGEYLLRSLRQVAPAKLIVCLQQDNGDAWFVQPLMSAKLGPVLVLETNSSSRLQHDLKAAVEGMS